MKAKRDNRGRVVKGGGSLNPGGLTKEQRAVIEKLGAKLRSKQFTGQWTKAYLLLLKEGNPVIVKDYADRVLGKAKDVVRLEDDEGKAINPYKELTLQQLLKIANGGERNE